MGDGECFSLTACSIGIARELEPSRVMDIEITEQNNLGLRKGRIDEIDFLSEIGKEGNVVIVVRGTI